MFQPANSSITLHQSKPMPRWLWLCIAKSLGIKTRPDDKPILATIFYLVTLLCTLTYFITASWYVVYDIQATTTKYDVLNGSVTIIMAAGFCFMTVYANGLAFKLFTNDVFCQSLRLHSKTVLKVSASLLIVILSLIFIGIYSYICFSDFHAEHCQKVQLNPVVCYIRYPSQIALSLVSFMWNLMVAVVCMAVCRTHTISIRHFLLELDADAILYEKLKQRQPRASVSSAVHWSPNESDTQTDDDEQTRQDLDNVRKIEAAWDTNEYRQRKHRISTSLFDFSASMKTTDNEQELPDTASAVPPVMEAPTNWESVSATGTLKVLSNYELLDRYWRLQCRLCNTSTVLQRWLASWIILIFLWSLYYLMYWIDHDASISDMIIFFIPLSLLPLLCSGPIEVNGVGQSVFKMIFPTEGRIPVIMFIKQAPLSITIYGFGLTYSTIVTAILAIAVAFGTKIIVGNIGFDGLPTPLPTVG